jgi:site-specific recombinase XerD
VAHKQNKNHALALLIGFLHGLRVSELVAIKGTDIIDGQLSVKRLKSSRPTLHAIRIDADPIFNESVIIELAAKNPGKLFNFSRQRFDEVIKKYGEMAEIHPAKLHAHALKHSICVLLWSASHDLSVVQDFVGHKSPSSTLIYMRTDGVQKAQDAVSTMSL